MNQRIYIDTSVAGGCFDKEFSEWSLLLFEEFKIGLRICVASDLFFEELENAPAKVKSKITEIQPDFIEIITVTEEALELAQKYIDANAVTEKWISDATHIATASIYKIDILASWNFKHIVNMNRIRIFNAVNLINGYAHLEIRTPREIINL